MNQHNHLQDSSRRSVRLVAKTTSPSASRASAPASATTPTSVTGGVRYNTRALQSAGSRRGFYTEPVEEDPDQAEDEYLPSDTGSLQGCSEQSTAGVAMITESEDGGSSSTQEEHHTFIGQPSLPSPLKVPSGLNFTFKPLDRAIGEGGYSFSARGLDASLHGTFKQWCAEDAAAMCAVGSSLEATAVQLPGYNVPHTTYDVSYEVDVTRYEVQRFSSSLQEHKLDVTYKGKVYRSKVMGYGVRGLEKEVEVDCSISRSNLCLPKELDEKGFKLFDDVSAIFTEAATMMLEEPSSIIAGGHDILIPREAAQQLMRKDPTFLPRLARVLTDGSNIKFVFSCLWDDPKTRRCLTPSTEYRIYVTECERQPESTLTGYDEYKVNLSFQGLVVEQGEAGDFQRDGVCPCDIRFQYFSKQSEETGEEMLE